MPPIVDEHRRRNESTRDRWDTMASHRARVTQLVLAARGATGRSLCVLGAGNANDIELSELADQFERIALVDLDHAALQRAVEQVSPAARQRISLHGGIDLTGVLPILETWQPGQTPKNAELAVATDAAKIAPAPSIGRFDVIASACVLTQLIDSIYLADSTEHPLRQQLVMAVRNRHLEMIIELLEPCGTGVLITDFVATETAPELATLNDEQLPAAAIHWINQHNFFTGANPYAIRDHLQRMTVAGAAVHDVEVLPAWRWNMGAKQSAVSALTFRRSKPTVVPT